MNLADALSLLAALGDLTSLSTLVQMAAAGLSALSALDQLGLPVGTALRGVLGAALLFWVMFGLYALVMSLYRAKLAGKLTRTQYVLGLPYVAAGVALDVLLNWTVGSVLLWDRPREWVMTSHMQRLRRDAPDSWGAKVAGWICDQGLDSLDPSGDHC